MIQGKDSKAYDSQGKIFVDSKGDLYTNKDSKVYITFPYTSVVEYVNVPDIEEEKEEN